MPAVIVLERWRAQEFDGHATELVDGPGKSVEADIGKHAIVQPAPDGAKDSITLPCPYGASHEGDYERGQ